MSEHLGGATLNLFVDGELGQEEALAVNAHLAECAACTSLTLSQMMLRQATAKAGRRYAVPAGLKERLHARGAEELAGGVTLRKEAEASTQRSLRWSGLGWVAAAVLLLAVGTTMFVERRAAGRAESAALVTEVFDQHVAVLAGSLPPQVVSTDRHTVKPWFQGKIPFSFNLPEGLAEDTALDGANLTYLHDQPVAQLLYHVGRHRVSVFLRERVGDGAGLETSADRAGYHVMSFERGGLEGVAISDVEPARLVGLVKAIEAVQGR